MHAWLYFNLLTFTNILAVNVDCFSPLPTVLGCCLPTDIASHSRSYAAVLEVSYGVSWVTKGYWQPVWRA